jgi:hypothetical protein
MRSQLWPLWLYSVGSLGSGLAHVPVAGAQDGRVPLSRVEVDVRGFTFLRRDTLAAFYRPGPVLHLLVSTPYHWRSLAGVGLDINRYARNGAAGQDYRAFFPFVRWGFRQELLHGLSATGGAGLGGLIMSFRPGPGAPAAHETELQWMADLGLQQAIGRGVSAGLTVEYRRAATAPAVGELLFGAGLSASIATPRAVRNVLLPAADSDPARLSDSRTAGSRELGDHLRLLDAWDRSTIDGLSWTLSPGGLSPLESPGWRVFLDGVPIELGVLGTRDPARLLIPLDYLEITAVERPAFATGGLAKLGAIHLTTTEVPEGVSASAYGDTGNEIGDPGPFRRTPLEGENMERLGHTPTIRGSIRRGPVFLTGALVYQTHGSLASVVNQRDRGFREVDWYPVMRRLAPQMSLGWNGSDATIRAYAGGSSAREIFFLPAWGRERAARDVLEYGGITASRRVTSGVNATAGFSRSRNQLDSLPFTISPAIAWRLEDLWSWVELASTAGSRAGLSWNYRKASTAHVLTDSTDAFWRFYASRGSARPSGWSWSAGAELTGGNASWRPSATAGVDWRTVSGDAAVLHVGLVQTVPGEQESFWLWAARGYRLAQDQGGVIEDLASPGEESLFTVDLSLTKTLSTGATISLQPFARRSRGLTLGSGHFEWDSTRRLFSANPIRQASAGGELAGFAAALHYEFRTGETDLSYRYQQVVGGDTDFRDAWASTPTHHARAGVAAAAARDLSVWSALEYRGPREWPAWGGIERPTLPWSSRVPGLVSLEASVRKLFAGGRAESRITIRAPLGGRLRYHPIGIQSRLQLWVGGEIRLGGLTPVHSERRGARGGGQFARPLPW